MIKLRETTTAYLLNGSDILLMKRADSRKFAPGVWAGVGGHVEPNELNNPYATCVREIFEETGIQINQIENLTLRYIVLRRSQSEIRLQYVYFGDTNCRDIIDTEEGKLYWIDKNHLFDRQLSVTSRLSLEYYLSNNQSNGIMVGTVFAVDSTPRMNWCPVQDWEGLAK